MRRQASYRWRLRKLMADAEMYSTTDLIPLLAEHGIELSGSQVHRLVTGTPERLSLPVLAALCDILQVTPNDLIETSAESATAAKPAAAAGGANRPGAADPSAVAPKRARIRPS